MAWLQRCRTVASVSGSRKSCDVLENRRRPSARKSLVLQKYQSSSDLKDTGRKPVRFVCSNLAATCRQKGRSWASFDVITWSPPIQNSCCESLKALRRPWVLYRSCQPESTCSVPKLRCPVCHSRHLHRSASSHRHSSLLGFPPMY
jgi:hypothetical protein